MLTIRLQRTGKKNQADFRIVLAEKHKSVSKKFKEILGSFNPRKKLFKIINETRLEALIKENINISPTVHNLLISQGLLQGDKVQSFKIKKKKKEEEKKEAPESTPAEGEEKKSEEAVPEEKAPETTPKTESKPEEKPVEEKSAEEVPAVEVKPEEKPVEDKNEPEDKKE